MAENDANGARDIFVRNLQTGTTTLVTVNRTGTAASGVPPQFSGGGDFKLSADGRFVTFDSRASDLVANDSNQVGDVFVRPVQ